MVNPMNKYAKQSNPLKSKKNKTDQDNEVLWAIEFQGGAWWNEKIGFYLPSENVEACIRSGLAKNRNGAKILGISIKETMIKLIHDAKAKNPEELFSENDGSFVDLRAIKVNRGNSIMRCRPRFDRWGFETELTLNENVLTVDNLSIALINAGTSSGLGDFRPPKGKYGTFVAELIEL
jgi:hypothetical protein